MAVLPEDIDVLIQEVGPRDGLQAVATVYPTEGKLAWIRAEAAAGVRQIQVGAFVPPKLLPQMADSAQVVSAAKQIAGLTVSSLVPNMKGAENAIRAGTDVVSFVLSASEEHNQRNVHCSVEESLERFARIVEFRDSDPAYHHVLLSGGIATAFGCTIAGLVEEKSVLEIVERFLELGADRIGLADTVGYANPAQVKQLFGFAVNLIGDSASVGAHFHDTRGLGLSNVFAAFEAGVREFDGSLGGLGGCPYAPGATGNIVTDDAVFMMESMGVRTGIDMDKLAQARRIMESYLDDEPTHGAFVKAGLPKGFELRPQYV
jgi:hydroxymethylglutaryl-CoA lyase